MSLKLPPFVLPPIRLTAIDRHLGSCTYLAIGGRFRISQVVRAARWDGSHYCQPFDIQCRMGVTTAIPTDDAVLKHEISRLIERHRNWYSQHQNVSGSRRSGRGRTLRHDNIGRRRWALLLTPLISASEISGPYAPFASCRRAGLRIFVPWTSRSRRVESI
jgi:hypothetical protein